MNTSLSRALCALVLALPLGCEAEPSPRETPPAQEVKKVEAGKNVTLEIQGDKRRVALAAVVCLREGQLEQLLTRKGTKEHEAVLAAEVDGRDVHKALLAAGAEAGSPVQFAPTYKAARGAKIKITLQWEEKGRLKSEDARRWIVNDLTKKEMTYQWVFAGSRFVKDPEGVRPDFYMANDGDLICVSNFESAMLDLPVNSPQSDGARAWAANTERIPPRDTKVTVYLEPIPTEKK